jgi:hypothetical protein
MPWNWSLRQNHLPTALFASLALLSSATRLSAQQAPPKFENFSATTANMAVGNGETLRINVSSWTTEADREKALAAFREKGEQQLLEVLRGAPSAGYIWTSESLGYTLRYAHKMPLPNGGERIILATDRPLGSWSRTAWKAAGGDAAQPALTVVELRLNRQGRGEGKMSFGAKIAAEDEGKTIALENYDKAPVLLKQAARVDDRQTH